MTAAIGNQEEWAVRETPSEALLARLSRAAYEVALRHGTKASFAELELAIWRELRGVLADPARRVDAA